MIRLLQQPAEVFSVSDKISNNIRKSPFAIKICSLASSYGTCYPFLSFYADEEGELLFAIADGQLTFFSVSADAVQRLDQCLPYLPQVCSIQGRAEQMRLLQSCSNFNQGAIYTLHRAGSGAVPILRSSWQFSSTVSIRDFLSFLRLHYPSFTIHNPNAFYCDLSHKIRHGGAKLFGLFVNGRLQSIACASFIYHTDMVISAVVTAGQSRRKGYAAALLRYAVQECNTCFVQVEDKKLYLMYEKLGFIQQGDWGEVVF